MNELRPARGPAPDPPGIGRTRPKLAPGPKIVKQFTFCLLRDRHLGG